MTKKKAKDDEKVAVALPTPPDGGWGWLVVLGSFFNHVVADGVAYSFGMFTGEFLKEFQCTRAEVGWIGSIMIGITWGAGPVVGGLVNRYGCRPVCIIGSIISCLSFALSIFATDITILYVTYGVCAGFGLGCIYLPSIVSVTYYFERKRGLATGIAVCGSGIGTFLFAPLFEILIAEYTWKGASLILSGALLNCAVFGFLFRPLIATEAGESFEDEECNGNKVVNEPVTLKHARLNDLVTGGEHFRSLQSLDKTNDLSSNGKVRRFGSESALKVLRRGSVREKGSSKEIGPLYKRDIFLYGASLQNIPAYKDNPQNFTRSMMSLPSIRKDEDAESEACEKGTICSPEMKDALLSMTDLSLLKEPLFLMFCSANFFISIGFCVPYLFLPDWAIDVGIDSQNAAFLISVIGIANTLGRLCFGYIADKQWVNRLVLYALSMVVCGIVTGLCPLFTTYAGFATYSAIFGAFLGVYVFLTSVCLVDILGLERLTNAMGLNMMFNGIAAVIGPPLAGWICDMTGSYDYSFYITGIIVLLSGFVCFLIPVWQRLCVKKADRKDSFTYPEEFSMMIPNDKSNENGLKAV